MKRVINVSNNDDDVIYTTEGYAIFMSGDEGIVQNSAQRINKGFKN